MSGTGIGSFTVGTNTYKYEELAPIEALRFGVTVTKSVGPALAKLGEAAAGAKNAKDVTGIMEAFGPALGMVDDNKLLELMHASFQHVYTPHNECLGNEAVFNSWFRTNKEDLYMVGLLSLYHLTKDFFPKALATAVQRYQK